MRSLILAITGASGAVYAKRLLEVLLRRGDELHLTISPAGAAVIKQELNANVSLEDFQLADLLPESADFAGNLRYFNYKDLMAPMASGSFLSGGMVICPCSGGTLSAIATGASTNLVQRAADVQLKEGRKLILVPRETPLSLIHLENMKRAAAAGAVILPASPGWYHGVQSPDDLVDFIVARILDQLGIEHELMKRWGGLRKESSEQSEEDERG